VEHQKAVPGIQGTQTLQHDRVRGICLDLLVQGEQFRVIAFDRTALRYGKINQTDQKYRGKQDAQSCTGYGTNIPGSMVRIEL
jgi:hypothetical protein